MQRATGKGIWLSIMCGAALAACGPRAPKAEQAGETPAAQAAKGPAAVAPPASPEILAQLRARLEPCDDQALWPKAVCAGAEMRKSADELAAAMAEKAGELSPEGFAQMSADQAAWAKSELVSCQAESDGNPVKTVSCMRASVADRLRDADQAVERLGGFTFQRRENVGVETVDPAKAPAGWPEDAPKALSYRLAWPTIDAPGNAAAKRFNALAARQRRFGAADHTEESTQYAITYAGKSLISVRFETYDNTPGSAHPNGGVKALNVLMTTGEPLKALDVFKAGSGWEEALTDRAMAGLADAFAELNQDPPRDLVRSAALRPEAWQINDTELTLLLSGDSLGGAYPIGPQEVKIPWDQLKRVLRPDAPEPCL